MQVIKPKFVSTFEKIIVPFVAGIIYPHFFDLSPAFVFSSIGVSLLLLILTAIKRQSMDVLMLLLYFLWGVFVSNNALSIKDEDHFSNSNFEYLVGSISEQPTHYDTNRRLTVEVSHGIDSLNNMVPSVGKISLFVENVPESKLEYGGQILIPATYQIIKNGFLPGTFDYRQYMLFKDIAHNAYLDFSEIEVLKRTQNKGLLYQALQSKAWLLKKIHRLMENKGHAAILSAILLGARDELDEETIQLFTFTGVIHIISVSGAHVALVFWLFQLLIRLLKNTKAYRFKWLFILSGIWAYIFITGLSVPASRAGIMISVFILGRILGRQNIGYNTLCVAAFIQLLFEPTALFSIGFQLSYLAVFGLLALNPIFEKFYLPKNKIGKNLVRAAYVSISAQATTSLVALYYFQYFPIYFLIANVFLFFPLLAIMYGGIFMVIIPSILGIWLSPILSLVIGLTETILRFVASLPGAYSYEIHINKYEVWLGIILLFLICRFRIYLMYKLSACLVFFIVFVAFHQLSAADVSKQKELIIYPSERGKFISLISADTGWFFVDGMPSNFTKKVDRLKKYYRLNTVHIFSFDNVDYAGFSSFLPYIKTDHIDIKKPPDNQVNGSLLIKRKERGEDKTGVAGDEKIEVYLY